MYTAPFIWIPAQKAEIFEKDGRYYTSERFQVHSIGYDKERNIRQLTIVNSRQQTVYEYLPEEKALKAQGRRKKEDQVKPASGTVRQSSLSLEQEQEMNRELERTGVALDAVLKRYHLEHVGQITDEIYTKAMKDLRSSRSRSAA